MFDFAMIFPGQGSQFVGMLIELSKKFKVVKSIFNRSSHVLGYDLFNLVKNGPEKELNKTYKTQPAVLTASYAIFKIWKENTGKMPKVMAGHSLGEYSALVCSGVISFESAIKLVEFRGKLMQKCISGLHGFMCVVIGLNSDLVVKLCREVSNHGIVSVANFNSYNQVVISGEKRSVENVINLCRMNGAKRIIPLTISVPAHCILMKPASKDLKKILDTINFKVPKIPIVNNVDVKIEYSSDLIKDALVRQLYSSVRWVDVINFIVKKKEIVCFLEIGPGRVLTSLNKNINKKINSIFINDVVSLEDAIISI